MKPPLITGVLSVTDDKVLAKGRQLPGKVCFVRGKVFLRSGFSSDSGKITGTFSR